MIISDEVDADLCEQLDLGDVDELLALGGVWAQGEVDEPGDTPDECAQYTGLVHICTLSYHRVWIG